MNDCHICGLEATAVMSCDCSVIECFDHPMRFSPEECIDHLVGNGLTKREAVGLLMKHDGMLWNACVDELMK